MSRFHQLSDGNNGSGPGNAPPCTEAARTSAARAASRRKPAPTFRRLIGSIPYVGRIGIIKLAGAMHRSYPARHDRITSRKWENLGRQGHEDPKTRSKMPRKHETRNQNGKHGHG